MELEKAQEIKRELPEVTRTIGGKARLVCENRAALFTDLLEASHKARVVWSQALDAIHAVFTASPYKTRNVTVFTTKQTRRGPTKADVKTAAKLLRHPALGWDVRFSAARDGSEFRIIYRHRSLIED